MAGALCRCLNASAINCQVVTTTLKLHSYVSSPLPAQPRLRPCRIGNCGIRVKSDRKWAPEAIGVCEQYTRSRSGQLSFLIGFVILTPSVVLLERNSRCAVILSFCGIAPEGIAWRAIDA